MKHKHFTTLLRNATLAMTPEESIPSGDRGISDKSTTGKPPSVKVQWDPERTPRLERLGYRSIQIGISSSLAATWADEWIAGIEDVTEKARALERELRGNREVIDEELLRRALVPLEREFPVPLEVRQVLRMD